MQIWQSDHSKQLLFCRIHDGQGLRRAETRTPSQKVSLRSTPTLKAAASFKTEATTSPRPVLLYRDLQSSRLRRNDIDEEAEARQPRFLLDLSLCNSVVGGIGLVSALSFGVITIVQSDTANRESRVANNIAGKSLFLNWSNLCSGCRCQCELAQTRGIGQEG
jgi:hypothetical protein